MKNTKPILIFTILLLASLACSLFGSGAPTVDITATEAVSEPANAPEETTAPQEATQPTAEVVEATQTEPEAPTAEPPAQAGPQDVLNLDDASLYTQFDDLQSYRTTLEYTFEAPGPITGTVYMDSATQVDPFQTKLSYTAAGKAVQGSSQVFTFAQILDTQYIVTTDFGCIVSSGDAEENPYESMLDPDDLLEGEAQYRGEETVNGIPAYGYEINLENIDITDPSGEGVDELTEGWIYISQEDGYILRLTLAGKGQDETLSGDPSLVGDMYYEINFLDFDQPVEVEIPAGCAGGSAADSEYPVPEDATNLTSMSGIMTFETGLSVEEAVDFYKSEMVAAGCNAPTEAGMAEAMSLSFSCPEGQVEVFIVSGDSGGASVTIFANQ